MVSASIVFGTQFVAALSQAPGILLVLAAAPLLQTSRLALILFTIDLALLLELVATQSLIDYRFGEALLARLVATAVHVALAGAVVRAWRRARRPDAPLGLERAA